MENSKPRSVDSRVPVLIRMVGNHFVFSCPPLQIHVTKLIDDVMRDPSEMARCWTRVVQMSQDEIKRRISVNKPIPEMDSIVLQGAGADLNEPYSLSVAQIANAYGLSESSVRNYADTGTLPCRRSPGGHRAFRESDVKAFFESASGAVVPEI